MSKSVRMAVESRPRLKLVSSAASPAPEEGGNDVRWLINGYPAVLTVWTEQEFERLEVRPLNARRLDLGFWCVLKME